MRVELVVDHEVGVGVGQHALAFAFRLPTEREGATVAREIHVVDAVVAVFTEEGA